MPPKAEKRDRSNSVSSSDDESDDDFNPETQAAEDSEAISSSDEEEAPTAQKPTARGAKKGKIKRGDHVEAIELDSGDEATIQERNKKRKRGEEPESDDEGGTGGFVRTRAQRMVEEKERRPLANTLGATIDVESVWARLSSMPVGRRPLIEEADKENGAEKDEKKTEDGKDYITIKRTIRYAGEVTTEEKRVHKHSMEARLYLEEQEQKKREKRDKTEPLPEKEATPPESDEPAKPVLRRPLKRPSRFEPNPTGEVKTLPPHLQLRWPRNKPTQSTLPGAFAHTSAGNQMLPPKLQQATKLNTVDKSRYDWASFVDKEGIAAELDEYGKSKTNYTGREEFLNRAQYRQEQGARDARVQAR